MRFRLRRDCAEPLSARFGHAAPIRFCNRLSRPECRSSSARRKQSDSSEPCSAPLRAKHAPLPSVRLDVQNDIPLGVGLGSSAAAIVAGILLGSALCGGPLPPDQLLRLAAEIEGHPDNVAAALHGGLVVAAAAGRRRRACSSPRRKFRQSLDFRGRDSRRCRCPRKRRAPSFRAQYSRRDVVANLQRTALLAARFFSGGELSPELFRDRAAPALSQPARSRNRGMPGVSPSGSGRSFPERRGFGGDGHCAAQRRGNWRGAGRRISAQGNERPGALAEGGQSRRADFQPSSSRKLAASRSGGNRASRLSETKCRKVRRHRDCK